MNEGVYNSETSLTESIVPEYKFSWKAIRRALELVFECSPLWASVNAAFVVVNGLMPLAMLWSIGQLVDATNTLFDSSGTLVQPFSYVLPWLILFGILVFASSALSVVSSMSSMELGERIKRVMSIRVHDQVMRLTYQTLLDPKFQSEAFRSVNGSITRPVNMFYTVLGFLQAVLTFFSLTFMLFSLSWWLPLVVMLAGAPQIIYKIYSSRVGFEQYRALSESERWVAYYNTVITSHRFSPEVRIFGLAPFFRKRYNDGLITLWAERIALVHKMSLWQLLTSLVSTVFTVGVYGVLIFLIISGGLSVGSLAMYLMAIRKCGSSVSSLSGSIFSMHNQGLFLSSLFAFLDYPSEFADDDKGTRFPVDFKSIDVNDVSFSYPSSRRQALSHVSFSVARGEVAAIVGENGSGKTTLVRLICGLLRPTSGSITIGGVDVRDIPQKQFVGHVSAVFQGFRIYFATARENIWFGNVNSVPTNEAISKAARQTDLDEMLSKLPDGYDTMLGDQFPGSEMFSIGEWQRLAISRTIFSDADIVLLDEPTSSLDPKSRQMFIEDVKWLKGQGKTVIVVTHTNEPLQVADKIITIEHCGKA